MSNKILELQEQLLFLDSQTINLSIASSYYDLAVKWKSCNRHDKSLSCFESALSFYKSNPKFYKKACDIAIQIGHLYRSMGQHKNCRSSYFESLKLSQVNQKDTLKSGAAYYHLGTLAEQTWNLKHAINFYEKSLAVYEAFSDNDIVSELKKILHSCNEKLLIYKK